MKFLSEKAVDGKDLWKNDENLRIDGTLNPIKEIYLLFRLSFQMQKNKNWKRFPRFTKTANKVKLEFSSVCSTETQNFQQIIETSDNRNPYARKKHFPSVGL